MDLQGSVAKELLLSPTRSLCLLFSGGKRKKPEKHRRFPTNSTKQQEEYAG
jgi:hypothetical protein